MDYTLREREIRITTRTCVPGNSDRAATSLPKRLRGLPTQLVQKLQRLHKNCCYVQLLNYYCPRSKATFGEGAATGNRSLASASVKSKEEIRSIKNHQGASDGSDSAEIAPGAPNGIEDISMLDQATPTANVSAFCRAVMIRLVPNEFWGAAEDCSHNRKIVLWNVDQFIKLRKYENLTLHEVMDGLRVSAARDIGQSKKLIWRRFLLYHGLHHRNCLENPRFLKVILTNGAN